jgi:hypothetical protein
MDPGLLSDLRNGIAAAGPRSDVYLDAYPADSSQTPRTTAEQTRFANWLAGVVRGLPGLKHVIVGNEPNLNLFWSPQFGPAGQDAAAVGYERLLARTYDAVKRVAPRVEVVGGTLAHSGTNKRRNRPRHALARPVHPRPGRGVPRLAPHEADHGCLLLPPYMERSDLPPTYRHNPLANTVTIADYGKLISLLSGRSAGRSRRDRPCRSSTTSSGSRRRSRRHARRSTPGGAGDHTSGQRGDTGAVLRRGFPPRRVPADRQDDHGLPLIDSPFLASFQSGVYYATA